MYLKKLYLIIASSILVLLLGICIFEFVFWNMNTNKLKESYENEIMSLEETVADIGPMGSVWTVSANTSPGQEVTEKDLVAVEMLEKSISKNYVLDPKKIIGKYFKVAIKPGTPLTEDLFMTERINNSSRQYEVVASVVPIGIKPGDYIDFRFVLPKGEDYIVMSHKRVELVLDKVITLYLTEEEIHTYQSLLLDYMGNEGSQIYMTKYLEPSIQKPAQIYYPVSDNVLYMMSTIDPNITELIEESVIKNNRLIFNNSLKNIPPDLIAKIINGRKEIVSSIDSANSVFKDMVERELQKKQDEMNNAEGTSENQDNEYSSIPPSDEIQKNNPKEGNETEESKPEETGDNEKSDSNLNESNKKVDSTSKNSSDSGDTSDKSMMDGVVE